MVVCVEVMVGEEKEGCEEVGEEKVGCVEVMVGEEKEGCKEVSVEGGA
jgi:hypothetical protein